jgi:uncharacterized protein (DUF2235 family)
VAVKADGMGYFRAVTEVGWIHQPVTVRGRRPNELSEFCWFNTVLNSMKTSFSGTFHPFRFDKNCKRFLGALNYSVNRIFSLAVMGWGVSCHVLLRLTARATPEERGIC